jgi:hypothetical protein
MQIGQSETVQRLDDVREEEAGLLAIRPAEARRAWWRSCF